MSTHALLSYSLVSRHRKHAWHSARCNERSRKQNALYPVSRWNSSTRSSTPWNGSKRISKKTVEGKALYHNFLASFLFFFSPAVHALHFELSQRTLSYVRASAKQDYHRPGRAHLDCISCNSHQTGTCCEWACVVSHRVDSDEAINPPDLPFVSSWSTKDPSSWPV